MLILSTTALFLMILSFIMMILATLISKKTFSDREKNSPFECGFDPKSSPRLPFSLQFFLIAVIFLIFDVEITLLIPLILVIKTSNMINFSILLLLFILILLLGTYHEWNQGALDWIK
uniref:NADH-ubiquinone oxidoreductase chain 3 n=1 Tax=Erotylidae sp. BMNH 1274780 TaxID=1796505 RepID=A0A126TGP4_9CUCU|nr:NADH dehydrogenase subunit 3 [Erotylidae sp. BMNH 1274780]